MAYMWFTFLVISPAQRILMLILIIKCTLIFTHRGIKNFVSNIIMHFFTRLKLFCKKYEGIPLNIVIIILPGNFKIFTNKRKGIKKTQLIN